MICLIGRMLDTPLTLELLMLMTAHLQVEREREREKLILPPSCSLYLATPCLRCECLMLAQANNSKLPVDTPKLVSLLTLALYVMALIPGALVIRQATYDAIQQEGGWHPSFAASFLFPFLLPLARSLFVVRFSYIHSLPSSSLSN